MKKLQFYIDRFLEHRKSLEQMDEAFCKLLDRFNIKNTELWILNGNIKGCLDFYKEAVSFGCLCRSFITYTYALAFKITNKRQENLFTESQYHLEFSLENFTKFLEENPIDSFFCSKIAQKGKKIISKEYYLSPAYGSKRKKLLELRSILHSQFCNARKEFGSSHFLKGMIEEELKNSEAKNNEDGSGIKKIISQDVLELIRGWNCKACTFRNKFFAKNCEVCGKENLEKNEQRNRKAFNMDEEEEIDGFYCKKCTLWNDGNGRSCHLCNEVRN